MYVKCNTPACFDKLYSSSATLIAWYHFKFEESAFVAIQFPGQQKNTLWSSCEVPDIIVWY